MQLNSSNLSARSAPATDRRRLVRYPCAAWVRAGARFGVASDMNNLGLSFHTWDHFFEDEVFDVSLSFDSIDDPPVQVVHPARVIWIRQYKTALQVAVEFLDVPSV